MFLNQHRLLEARVEVGLGTVDLDAGAFLYDPPHAAILFSPQCVPILRQAPFQVFRLSNVNQFVALVVNKVDARRTG